MNAPKKEMTSMDDVIASMNARQDTPGTAKESPSALTIEDEKGRGWDLFSRLLQDRIIRLDGQVDDNMSRLTCAALHLLEQDSPDKPITMMINSPGGSVVSGLAIIDAMKNNQCPINTVAYGDATSMGSLILCSGDKRFASPNTRILIHQPLMTFGGNSRMQQTEIGVMSKDMEETRERLTAIYAKKTGLPYEVIDELIERDNALSAEQAKKLGVIDEVLTQEVYFQLKKMDVPKHKQDPYPDNVRTKPRQHLADHFNDMIERAAKTRPQAAANQNKKGGNKKNAKVNVAKP
ncbi:MAG: ATP-dependent Clp protease proteolytic subunit [Alphaproteobacteria bacterium]|nr:ATP-dependent Clp protease proteolytic subunit [Alphaproteobacteria bacterium]